MVIRILGGGPQDLKYWNGSCGGGPQDLKNCNARKKITEHTVNKTTKKLFIKTYNNYKGYIVVDNLSF